MAGVNKTKRTCLGSALQRLQGKIESYTYHTVSSRIGSHGRAQLLTVGIFKNSKESPATVAPIAAHPTARAIINRENSRQLGTVRLAKLVDDQWQTKTARSCGDVAVDDLDPCGRQPCPNPIGILKQPRAHHGH